MIKPEKNCTGCMACLSACPKDAISIGTDADGFFVPQVDANRCIQCGRCTAVCPLGKAVSEPLEPVSAVCLQHRDESVLANSSSGGAMYLLAQHVLASGGVVFGCAFDPESQSFFCTNTDVVSLDLLMKSKYAESRIDDAYRKVAGFLQSNRQVLFCGTPCEVAGLKRCLAGRADGLLTATFTCGGVPSQRLLMSYLSEIGDGSRVQSVSFREKTFGWRQYCLRVSFESGKEYLRFAECDPYLWTFLKTDASKRPCCASCSFQAAPEADLVFADYWRYNGEVPGLTPDHGVSLVLACTQKGAFALDACLHETRYQTLDPKDASYNLTNRRKNEQTLAALEADRAYIRENGLKRFYRSRIRPTKYVKYRIRELLRRRA